MKLHRLFARRTVGGSLAAGALIALAAGAGAGTGTAGGPGTQGAVFVATNHNNTSDRSQPANQVVMYTRAANGALTLAGRFATGGQGSGPGMRFAGDGLGSGNSVRLSRDARFLFVTNAGSNSVTVFRVRSDGLERTDVAPTGSGKTRRFPNSVTQHGNLVYVLNSADGGSITGFRLSSSGTLAPLAGSTRGLDAKQLRYAPDALYNPTQVEFTPDGSKLVVTIKDGPAKGLVPMTTPTGPGRVLVWNVDKSGRPSRNFTRTDFENRGPFGFSFDRRGNLLLALFLGGPTEMIKGKPTATSSVGSYRINDDRTLTTITNGEADHQVDTCWLVNNGRYAYGSNYGSGTISSFRLGSNGSLTLMQKAAGRTVHPGNKQGSTPLDLRTSRDGRFLYLVQPGSGKVGGWRINADGSLTKLGEWAGIGKTVDGDHALKDFGALASPAGIEAT